MNHIVVIFSAWPKNKSQLLLLIRMLCFLLLFFSRTLTLTLKMLAELDLMQLNQIQMWNFIKAQFEIFFFKSTLALFFHQPLIKV